MRNPGGSPGPAIETLCNDFAISFAPGHVPVQRAALPHIDERLHEERHEDADGDHARPSVLLEANCPCEQEDDLHVEDHEQHRHEIELHREPLDRLLEWNDPTLVRSELLRSGVVRRDPPRQPQGHGGKANADGGHQHDWEVVGKRHWVGFSSGGRLGVTVPGSKVQTTCTTTGSMCPKCLPPCFTPGRRFRSGAGFLAVPC
jgi:hypothetical protein